MGFVQPLPRRRIPIAERIARTGARLVALAAYAAAAVVAFVLLQPVLEPVLERTDPTAGRVLAAEPRFDRVHAGDTLGLVAFRNGTSVPALVALNPDIDPISLHTRERIRVE